MTNGMVRMYERMAVACERGAELARERHDAKLAWALLCSAEALREVALRKTEEVEQ